MVHKDRTSAEVQFGKTTEDTDHICTIWRNFVAGIGGLIFDDLRKEDSSTTWNEKKTSSLVGVAAI